MLVKLSIIRENCRRKYPENRGGLHGFPGRIRTILLNPVCLAVLETVEVKTTFFFLLQFMIFGIFLGLERALGTIFNVKIGNGELLKFGKWRRGKMAKCQKCQKENGVVFDCWCCLLLLDMNCKRNHSTWQMLWWLLHLSILLQHLNNCQMRCIGWSCLLKIIQINNTRHSSWLYKTSQWCDQFVEQFQSPFVRFLRFRCDLCNGFLFLGHCFSCLQWQL